MALPRRQEMWSFQIEFFCQSLFPQQTHGLTEIPNGCITVKAKSYFGYLVAVQTCLNPS